MVIIESSSFKKDKQKNLKGNPQLKNKLNKLIGLLLVPDNMQDLMGSHIRKQFNIESKTGNLKEYYSASLDKKFRLVFKPVGEHPYNLIEIDEIKLVNVNNHDYKKVKIK